MCCACEMHSPLRGISRNRRGPSFDLIVVAIVGILLIASTRAFGLTIADLDPSHLYKLEKIDLSGEHAFPRDVVVSVMTTKERPKSVLGIRSGSRFPISIRKRLPTIWVISGASMRRMGTTTRTYPMI